MKKIGFIILSAAIAVSLCACSGSKVKTPDFECEEAYRPALEDLRAAIASTEETENLYDGFDSVREAAAELGAAAEDTIGYVFNDTDKDGREIAKEQLILNEKVKEPGYIEKKKAEFTRKKDRLIVDFEGGTAVFSLETGALTSYEISGKQMLVGTDGFAHNLYRAFLDNDRNIVKGWEPLEKLVYTGRLSSYEAKDKEGRVKIVSKGNLSFGGKVLFECEIKYTIFPSGIMSVKPKVWYKSRFQKRFEVPRYGLSINLDKSLQNITYYGLGELENLNDFKAQSLIGIYNAKLEELNVDYIRPQENGNHGECRYVRFTDGEGKGIMIHSRKNFFSFSAHNYSNKTLRKAKHLEDIKDDSLVCLNIDGFVRGTGTNSCGPGPLKEYRVDFKDELSFSFYIVPLM